MKEAMLLTEIKNVNTNVVPEYVCESCGLEDLVGEFDEVCPLCNPAGEDDDDAVEEPDS